jgi:transposase
MDEEVDVLEFGYHLLGVGDEIGREIRHQPGSALTLWFQDRIERNGGRRRKTTIVALARKLLVALWKYVSAGVVIEGAVIRPA